MSQKCKNVTTRKDGLLWLHHMDTVSVNWLFGPQQWWKPQRSRLLSGAWLPYVENHESALRVQFTASRMSLRGTEWVSV